jgi:hypothetical protein
MPSYPRCEKKTEAYTDLTRTISWTSKTEYEKVRGSKAENLLFARETLAKHNLVFYDNVFLQPTNLGLLHPRDNKECQI